MTPQQVIKAFMSKLDNHGYINHNTNDTNKAANNALDAAIRASTTFKNIGEATTAFLQDLQNSSSADDFLTR